MLADISTSIPVISPIEIIFPRDVGARLLPAGAAADEHEPDYPDYTVQALAPQALPAPDPAVIALDEIEHAAAVSEYHDFEWWRTRILAIRPALGRSSG